MSTLLPGTIFAARYRIVGCLAAGGMGAVYEVVHIETERKRALKVMHPHILHSAELRERFKQEARVAAQIESDFIVDVFDAGVDEATQTPFLVMELLRGEELGKRLKRFGRFAPVEALMYLEQTALALDKTHKASIVHRDLKPENLFLAERDHGGPIIKVLDFGVAKLLAEGATHAGATRSVGTPLYMAPEQFRGESKISAGVDIYALGMMAYTLLVGDAYWAREALQSGNVFVFATNVVRGPQQPPSARALEAGVSLPLAFDAWFSKATANNREDRFQTAVAAIAALTEALGVDARGGLGAPQLLPGAPRVEPVAAVSASLSTGSTGLSLSAAPTTVLPRPAPSARRRGLLVGSIAMVTLSGGLVVVLGPWRHPRAPVAAVEVSSAQAPAPSASAEGPASASATVIPSASPAVAPTIATTRPASRTSAVPVGTQAIPSRPPPAHSANVVSVPVTTAVPSVAASQHPPVIYKRD
jgi:serine/threonine-protein kinase